MRFISSAVVFSIFITSSINISNSYVSMIKKFKKNLIFSLEISDNAEIIPVPAVSASSAALATKIGEATQAWLSKEPLENILPKRGVSSSVKEIQGNVFFWETNKILYEKWWLQFEDTMRDEKRPFKDIIGQEGTLELLTNVESADVYDPVTVRAFLSNPAFETMIGGILYEGIFEFIQRVDIIGNIVNGLPIIGPIRQTIMSEFKKNLDKTLGGQVKTFLSSFQKIAVQRMIEFVLSPTNRLSLQKANRNVVQSLMERPFDSLMPDRSTTFMLRDRLWQALRETPTSEAVSLVDLLYEKVGSNTFSDFTDAQELLDAMPSARKIIQSNIGRFLDTEEGILLLQDMALAALK